MQNFFNGIKEKKLFLINSFKIIVSGGRIPFEIILDKNLRYLFSPSLNIILKFLSYFTKICSKNQYWIIVSKFVEFGKAWKLLNSLKISIAISCSILTKHFIFYVIYYFYISRKPFNKINFIF